MNQYYRDLGNWIKGQIDKYIDYVSDGGDREQVNQSGNYESHWRIRASSMDGCPKVHAAERRGEVKKTFDQRTKWKFELANRAADVVKEALVWMAKRENEVNGTTARIIWDTYTEYRVEREGVPYSGTFDGLLVGRQLQEDSKYNRGYIYYPIEVKRTDNDKYDGLSPSQVWQLITYMKIMDSQAGFLITIYNYWSDEGTHKVWPVVRVENGYTVLSPITGEPAVFEGDDWPRVDGTILFSDLDMALKVALHQKHYEESGLPAPYASPNWRCGMVKPADYYQRGYTNPSTGQKFEKGDLKPGTGVIRPTCPLFMECWGKIFGLDQVPEYVTFDSKTNRF